MSVEVGAKVVKDDRRYSREHEWALRDGGKVLVGITAFAVDQLGDITLVNLDVAAGQRVQAGKVFGTIESVKTLSDLFSPLSGVVESINPALEREPEVINDDPWTKGWMIRIQPDDPASLDQLMDASEYRQFVESLES
jgi:glycine cleavage system H protein